MSGLSALISVVFSITVYKKQQKNKNLVWSHKTLRLTAHPSVFKEEVRRSCSDIDRTSICITMVLLWNAGKECIRREDVKSKLSINFPDDQRFLDKPKILQTSRPEICFITEKNGNKISFSFDFLDYEDGALLEVVHCCPIEPRPAVMGKLRGRNIPIPPCRRNSKDFVDCGFIEDEDSELEQVILDTTGSYQITGVIIGMLNGISLANVRKKGAKARIIGLASFLMVFVLAWPFVFAEVPCLSFWLIIPIIVVFFFAYYTGRIIASIVTFPRWFDYKYL